MLCRKAELLVFMKSAGTISSADEQLLDLIHPLAESSIYAWLQQNMEYERHIEYLPVGEPLNKDDYALEDIQFKPGGTGAVLRSQRGGTDYLQLKHTPVTTFGIEVCEDLDARGGQNPNGAFGPDTVLTLGEDYYLDSDERLVADGHSVHLSRSGILRRIGAWAVEPRTVRVTYYGGWSATQLTSKVAGAVKLAALETVVAAFWAAKHSADNEGRGPKMSESIGKYSYSVGQHAAGMGAMALPPSAIDRLQAFRSYRYL